MVETKFKETEVGRVPVDWDVKTLEEITKDTSYGVAAEAIPYNGIHRYIRITDISDENGSFQPNPLTSPSFFNEEHLVKENDLLVARTGASVGKTYLYNHKDGQLIYAGFLIKTNVFKADSKYVFYYTQTYPYKLWVLSESMRSGQPGINAEQLKSLTIPIPSLSEQQRIAEALSSIDSLIDSLDKLIEKKRLIKQGAMQELLTGKKRLPGFTGEWEEKTLGDVCTPYKGKQINKDNLSETNTYPVMNGGVSPSGFHSGYNTEANTIIISEGGNSCGFVNYINTPFWAGGHCYVLDIHNELDKLYLYHLLKFNESNIMSLRTGTGLPNIKKSALCEFKLTLTPLISEQRKIASILSSMDEDIAALEQKRDKYIAIKKGMMQQLLTGKIRLI